MHAKLETPQRTSKDFNKRLLLDYPVPSDEGREQRRLASLRSHHILDTPPGEDFDDLVRLAAIICDVPIAAISFIDEHRQWIKAATGLSVTEIRRENSFCAHTILGEDLMTVPDATANRRFSDNPLVKGDPGIRFYVGFPLMSEDGYALGSLCVIDRVPRELTAAQEDALRLLGRQGASQLAKVRTVASMKRLMSERDDALAERARLAAIVDGSVDAIVSIDLDGIVVSCNKAAEEIYQRPASELIGADYSILGWPSDDTPTGDILRGVMKQGRIDNVEVTRCDSDGLPFYISFTFSPIVDHADSIVGISGVGRDITKKRLAEQEKREADQALQAERDFQNALLESLCEGIVACDADGTLSLFNNASREFHGLTATKLPPDQ